MSLANLSGKRKKQAIHRLLEEEDRQTPEEVTVDGVTTPIQEDEQDETNHAKATNGQRKKPAREQKQVKRRPPLGRFMARS